MKKIIVFTLFITVVLLMLPLNVSADLGPHSATYITFTDLGDKLCYGTLLSEYDSTGPAGAWDGDPKHAYYHEGDEEYEIWKAFIDYDDTDGYYFLQWFWRVDETKKLDWGYYPPDKFKILLYFPDSNTYMVSGIAERYAFYSYFNASMSSFVIDDNTSSTYIFSEPDDSSLSQTTYENESVIDYNTSSEISLVDTFSSAAASTVLENSTGMSTVTSENHTDESATESYDKSASEPLTSVSETTATNTVDASSKPVQSIAVTKNHNYTWDIVSFIIRVLITLIIEIGIALIFGYRKGKQILFIGLINIFTQVLLNIALNIFCVNQGFTQFIIRYILLELLVFIIEAIAYYFFLHRFSWNEKKRSIAIIYAFVANLTSLLIGIVLFNIFPTLF